MAIKINRMAEVAEIASYQKDIGSLRSEFPEIEISGGLKCRRIKKEQYRAFGAIIGREAYHCPAKRTTPQSRNRSLGIRAATQEGTRTITCAENPPLLTMRVATYRYLATNAGSVTANCLI